METFGIMLGVPYIFTSTGVRVGQDHGGVVPHEEIARRLRIIVDDDKVDECREPADDKRHAHDNHRLVDVYYIIIINFLCTKSRYVP